LDPHVLRHRARLMQCPSPSCNNAPPASSAGGASPPKSGGRSSPVGRDGRSSTRPPLTTSSRSFPRPIRTGDHKQPRGREAYPDSAARLPPVRDVSRLSASSRPGCRTPPQSPRTPRCALTCPAVTITFRNPAAGPAALLPRMSLQVLTAAGAGGERNRLALELTRLHRPAGGNGPREVRWAAPHDRGGGRGSRRRGMLGGSRTVRAGG